MVALARRVCVRERPRPSERGEHRQVEWGRRVCGGLSSTLGGSEMWPQCWLCAVCAVGRAGCCGGGGGVPCGGKHIIILCTLETGVVALKKSLSALEAGVSVCVRKELVGGKDGRVCVNHATTPRLTALGTGVVALEKSVSA